MRISIKIILTFLTLVSLICSAAYAQEKPYKYIIQGIEQATAGNFIKSKEHFEKALEVSPKSKSIKDRLVVINDALAQKIKKDTAIHIFKALSYEGEKQFDLAIQEINMAIEINPNYAIAYSDRGGIQNKKNQPDLAIQDFNKAIEIDPKYAMAYKDRAEVYVKKRQFDKAIQDYTRAIEIDPKDAGAFIGRADIYARKMKFDMAIKDHTKAIELEPNRVAAYYNRGIYYLQVKNIGKGCADFKKACELGHCAPYNSLKKQGRCKWWKFWE